VGAVFLVGVVVGVLGASLYFEAKIDKMFHGRPPGGEEVLARLTKDLGLTPHQQEEIRPLIMDFDRQASDLRKQFLPQMKALHEKVTAQIRAKLEGEQKTKFDEITERLRGRFEKRPPYPAASPAKE
jgi:hypothetical protein